jgi:hypothetical protein
MRETDSFDFIQSLTWGGGIAPAEYPCGEMKITVFSHHSPEWQSRGYVNPQPGLNLVVELALTDENTPERRRLLDWFVLAEDRVVDGGHPFTEEFRVTRSAEELQQRVLPGIDQVAAFVRANLIPTFS